MKDLLHSLQTLAISAKDAGIPKAEINSTQLGNVVSGVLVLAGAVTVVFIVLAGIKYSTSQGEPAQIQKAKEQIIYALVGLVFVIFAFTIVRFAVGQVFK